MRRADRLFRLVQLLRQRRLWTAADLASALEVSKRTVYRDVRDLVESGVPVRGEAGVGYALERGFELPPSTFNHEELEALVMGARVVSSWGDPELQQAAASALEKVEAVLPEPLRATVASTAIYAPRVPRNVIPEHLVIVRRAVAARRQLQFGYGNRRGVRTIRTMSPVGLHFWGRVWSVAGWCELREDWRTFRVDRMSEVEVGDAFDLGALGGMQAYMSHVREEAAETGWSVPDGLGD